MSQRTENGSQTLTSLADLGIAFGLAPVDVTAFSDHEEELVAFRALPVIDQLSLARARHGAAGRFAKELSVFATRATLTMDPQEREHEGISLITYVPLDEDGRLAIPDLSNYRVCTLFPEGERKSYVIASRLGLQATFTDDFAPYVPEIVAEIDRLVTAQVELRPETVVDRYARSIQQIKTLDMVIKQGKRSAPALSDGPLVFGGGPAYLNRTSVREIEWLNDLKDRSIYDYLLTAGNMGDLFPYVMPLFDITPGDDSLHTRLIMQQPLELNIHKRLIDSYVSPIVQRGTLSYSTNINSSLLKGRRDLFLKGSQDELDRTAHDLLELLYC